MIKVNAKSASVRRKKRIRAKIFGTEERPRLAVFRSNKYIYVQLIDDKKGHTMVSADEREIMDKKAATRKHGNEKDTEDFSVSVLPEKYSKTERAKMVGQILAQKALVNKINTVVFDRRGYKYHGRVKALADGARSGGLKF